jgi:hypothetical protein
MKMKFSLLLAATAIVIPAARTAAQAAPQPQAGVADANGAAADSTEPTPGDAAASHPDEDQAIVITGVKRPAGDVLGRGFCPRQGNAGPRCPAEHR